MDFRGRSIVWHNYSTWMKVSLPQHIHIGSSGLLTFLQIFLNEWACGKIMEIQWVWSSRSATFLSGTPTQRMDNG